MRTGLMRDLVELQEDFPTADEYNEPISNWITSPNGKIWAQITPLSGVSLERARQLSPRVTHEIRVRYNPDVKTQCRIKHGDRYFEIDSVIDVRERHAEMRLMCYEQV